MSRAEDRNAVLSLATNLTIGDAVRAHHIGVFRVMPEPDAGAVLRLRHTAAALDLSWPGADRLAQFHRALDPAKPRDAAFMPAIRRAGEGAAYVPYRKGVVPWHAAMAPTDAQATAPLRRLADRHVVRATLATCRGEAVPDRVTQAFEKLPRMMARADALAGRIDRAVIDLAEAAMLGGRIGETFAAAGTNIDERGARIQLRDLPVIAHVATAGAAPGDALPVRLTGADTSARPITVAMMP